MWKFWSFSLWFANQKINKLNLFHFQTITAVTYSSFGITTPNTYKTNKTQQQRGLVQFLSN